MLQILDEEGRIRKDLEPALTPDELKRIYGLMVMTRAADGKALKLQRQGRLGTYASSLGHEACQVGTAFSLRNEDWIFPYFRDLGLYIAVGYPLALYFQYWMGNEDGLRTPEGLNLFSFAIPVASQILHAVGAGMAANFRKTPLAVVATFGDGATSEGDFHEGLNFAGVFKTPTVFVCYNNQWAISTPRKRQTAAETIAQKAFAYGFSGVAVDGNDVLAVLSAVREAADRARRGQGPTLIEAVTYRMGHHTTSDDASRYREVDELKEWEAKDPLRRFRLYLKGKGLWDDAFEKELEERTAEDVENAVADAESRPIATPEEVFAYTYAAMTPQLAEQLSEFEAFLKESGR